MVSDPRILSEEFLVECISEGRVAAVMLHIDALIDALTEERERLRGLVDRAVPIVTKAADQGAGHNEDHDGCHKCTPHVNGKPISVMSDEYTYADAMSIEWVDDPCPACEEAHAWLEERQTSGGGSDRPLSAAELNLIHQRYYGEPKDPPYVDCSDTIIYREGYVQEGSLIRDADTKHEHAVITGFMEDGWPIVEPGATAGECIPVLLNRKSYDELSSELTKARTRLWGVEMLVKELSLLLDGEDEDPMLGDHD